MEAQLVSQLALAAMSELIYIHHLSMACAANEEDQETAGAVGTTQQLI